MSSAKYRFATANGHQIEWFLRQNCALTPRQCLGCYGFLSAVSLSIGIFFWTQGATFILAFSALEVLVLGIGFLCFARRALDRERICIDGNRVTVECELEGVLRQVSFERAWLRVECPERPQQLIALRGQGQLIKVGRFVRPEWRTELAAEIRRGVHAG